MGKMMCVVKSPDGLLAIFEEEAAGFTSLKLDEGRARAALAAAGFKSEEVDAAIKTPARTWAECLARIREIFAVPPDAHPCVTAALRKALENRMSTIARELGAKAL